MSADGGSPSKDLAENAFEESKRESLAMEED